MWQLYVQKHVPPLPQHRVTTISRGVHHTATTPQQEAHTPPQRAARQRQRMSAAADAMVAAAQAGGDGGVFKFVGGLVLGFVLRSIGGYFLEQPPAAQGKKASAARSRKPAAGAAAAAAARPREECKMVLCVNTSLGMGKGKIGAQCAHAAVGVIGMYRSSNPDLFRQWERHGQPKIALKIKDDAEMEELARQALQRGLPAYIVHDAGRTQIAAGSQTVLAIGPAPKSVVDLVTGHLSLL